uniref:Uncharacterized protein n=1 Tax=Arundo donax TaxID=35708 RepID=A0A0A9H790_ARUDO
MKLYIYKNHSMVLYCCMHS